MQSARPVGKSATIPDDVLQRGSQTEGFNRIDPTIESSAEDHSRRTFWLANAAEYVSTVVSGQDAILPAARVADASRRQPAQTGSFLDVIEWETRTRLGRRNAVAKPDAPRTVSPAPLTFTRQTRKWQGRVTSLGQLSRTFEAEVVALSDDDDSFQADFSMDLLTESEQRALRPGTVVYVTMQVTTNAFGRPRSETTIRVQRLGKWSTDELDAFFRQSTADFKADADLFE